MCIGFEIILCVLALKSYFVYWLRTYLMCIGLSTRPKTISWTCPSVVWTVKMIVSVLASI